QDVVYAMIDKVAAYSGVHVHGDGHFQLRSHAIGARNQNWFFEFFLVEFKQCAEVSDATEHSVRKRARGKMADAILRVVRDSDIDSGVCVSHVRALRATFTFRRATKEGFATKLKFFAASKNVEQPPPS